MKVIMRVWLALFFVVFMIGAANAEVINFDDLNSGTNLTGSYSSYAGLTWGTSTDDSYNGLMGLWRTPDVTDYATPHSSPNCVLNAYGPNNLWFAFSSPVTFDGAWFATAVGALEGHRATEMRFRDDNEVSGWLTLSATPQFLSANFTNSTTIWVERSGGDATDTPARWYTMDDITYNASQVPEPTTMLLLGSGLLGLVALRRNFKA